jgi:hypothetical protein
MWHEFVLWMCLSLCLLKLGGLFVLSSCFAFFALNKCWRLSTRQLFLIFRLFKTIRCLSDVCDWTEFRAMSFILMVFSHHGVTTNGLGSISSNSLISSLHIAIVSIQCSINSQLTLHFSFVSVYYKPLKTFAKCWNYLFCL